MVAPSDHSSHALILASISFTLGVVTTYLYLKEETPRIGELPVKKTRTHWPWDRIIRTSSRQEDDEPDEEAKNETEKSDLCIGSIFGLDVGGTLAKLVYFEERSPSEVHPSHRDHNMRKRRSSTTEIPYDKQMFETLSRSNSVAGTPSHFHTTDSVDNIKKAKNMEEQRRHPHSESMLDLSQRQAEALTRFYQFAQTLDGTSGVREEKLSIYSKELGGDLHFIRFETRRMKDAMKLLRQHGLHYNIREIGATGGGAHKFAELWETELGIEMKKQQELASLVAGMQFILSTVVGECYTFRPHDSRMRGGPSSASSTSLSSYASSDDLLQAPTIEESSEDDRDSNGADEWWWSRKVQRDAISYSSTYPYLLVTIGTGVSILRVDGPRKHERISGSTIGGGTYLGLIRLLTEFEDYDDIMRLAEKGDPSKVDMLVGDIYGDNQAALEKLGLPANLVASSFGKLVAKEDPAQGVTKEDLARALLLMVTNNIGQVAYLNAKLCKTSRIYFVGNFLRQNRLSQRRLAFAIDYWSKGEMEALFLEHEGYFGALGAFLLSQGITNSEDNPKHWKSEANIELDSDSKGHRRSHTYQHANTSL